MKSVAGCDGVASERVVDHVDGLHAPHHALEHILGEGRHVHLSHLDTGRGKAIVNVVSAERTETTRMLPHAKEARKTESVTTGHGAPYGAVHLLEAHRALAGIHLFQSDP